MKKVLNKAVKYAKMSWFARQKHLKPVMKTVFFIFLLAVIGFGFVFFNWVMGVLDESRDLDVSLIVSTNTTEILDRHGDVARETGTTRARVPLYEISPVMIDAMLAIEDARFFEHDGVDWTRTLGAQVFNVRTFVQGLDGGVQGGSTLTQQLINQTHLLSEDGLRDVSIERKLQEMLLSFQIERVLSKDQILEAYLNYSPFGGGIYGIQAASEFYFGVNASQLTLAQAATLAGLVQAPNDWRPDWNAHLTEERRNEVLDMMERHGYINAALRDLAAAEPITDMLVYYVSDHAKENAIFQDYVNHVLNEAYERWGINAHEGYIIETHLDPDIQETLFNAMTTNYPVAWPDEHIQSATSVIETQSGYIRGLAGRDLQRTYYEQSRERGFVMPTDIQRPIGSTSKPIWAYGPAMEHLNWGPGTMLNDDVFAYQSGELVRNWSLEHEGRVTLRQAMAPSWNPPALQAFNAVMNVDQGLVVDFVTGLGIPESQVGFYDEDQTTILESYALGGNRTGLAPLHLTGAYAAFGNQGVYNEPRAIARIIAPNGAIYYDPSQVQPSNTDEEPAEPFRTERVMREATAYMMTDVLRTSVTPDGSPDHGPMYYRTGYRAHIPGWFVAAKTGTTDLEEARVLNPNTYIPADAVGDVWIAGYTNEFTMAVWVGYESINHSVATGNFLNGAARNLPDHLFREVMQRLPHPDGPPTRPPRPGGVVESGFELMSGTEIGQTCLPSAATPWAFSHVELFHAGHGPSCTSTRFSMPNAPSNFQVNANGTTLAFSWDHIDDLPMTLAEAQSAVSRARGIILGSNFMTDAIRNMNPTEGQAAMMVRQIQAIGETEYAVIATLQGGTTQELGVTTDNYLQVNDLSISDIAVIQSFHVITRFAQSGQSSGPSNVQPNDNIIDPSDLEIVIPDMEGWTLSMFQEWANEHNIMESTITEAHSDTVAEGRIITTNPIGTMTIDQRIRITISLGPLVDDDSDPDSTQPSPDPDVPGDPDPDDWCAEDDPLCDLIQLMAFINKQRVSLPR